MAMPPTAFIPLLQKSHAPLKDAFGNVNELEEWGEKSEYMKYGSMTFHWTHKVELPALQGQYKTDWGVVFIVISNAMKLEGVATSVSCAITKWNTPSKVTGKTPLQYDDIESCRLEAFRQWKEAIRAPNLPTPDYIVGDQFLEEEESGEDGAFFKAAGVPYLDAASPTVPGLYQLGCQNGHQRYHFTSLEAAVSNAAHLLHQWFPESEKLYPIYTPLTLGKVLLLVVLVLLMLLVASVLRMIVTRVRY